MDKNDQRNDKKPTQGRDKEAENADPVFSELQSKLSLSAFGAGMSLLAAAISAVCRLPSPFWIFLLLCCAMCAYNGVRYVKPLRNRSYYAIDAECVEKETHKLRRHYCKYYFDSKEAGPFNLESSNRHKYYVHRKYGMVFTSKDLPLTGEYLLLCIPVTVQNHVDKKI
jgi:hypothetical protein